MLVSSCDSIRVYLHQGQQDERGKREHCNALEIVFQIFANRMSHPPGKSIGGIIRFVTCSFMLI